MGQLITEMNQVIQLVIDQIYNAFMYIPGGYAWAASITIAAFLSGILWRFYIHKSIRWTFWCRLLPLFLFVVYVYCILQLTILSRKPGSFGGMDWRILARWNESDAQKAFLIMNLIMFIPLGILLPMFGKWAGHILVSWPIAIICSTGIEMIQLKYRLGFCQLDDIIANSVGFLVGFLGYLILQDVFFILRGIVRAFLKLFDGR